MAEAMSRSIAANSAARLSNANMESLLEKYRSPEPRAVGRAQHVTELHDFIDLSKIDADDLSKLSATFAQFAAQYLLEPSTSKLCATRIALHYKPDIMLLAAVVARMQIRPAIVDLDASSSPIKGRYFSGERAIFLHDFTTTGFTPLSCIAELRKHNVSVKRIVSFFVREDTLLELREHCREQGVEFKVFCVARGSGSFDTGNMRYEQSVPALPSCRGASSDGFDNLFGTNTSVTEVVAEKDDLIVILDVAPVRPGHALIVTRSHERSFASRWRSEPDVINAIIGAVVATLAAATGQSAVVCEHGLGVRSFGPAGCVEHAHIHVIPTDGPLVTMFRQAGVNLKIIEDFGRVLDSAMDHNTFTCKTRISAAMRHHTHDFPASSCAAWLRNATAKSFGVGVTIWISRCDWDQTQYLSGPHYLSAPCGTSSFSPLKYAM